jgi:putative restriction endonuclease
MRFFLAVTDDDWFSYLSGGVPPDEVNFWQPSGNVQFRALQPGEPFLFKLHSPNDFIVGGGFFGHFSILPISLAWETFGQNNGAKTIQEMRERVERYRRSVPSPGEDYDIGCILLESPFFFRREDWIPLSDWSRNIVRGKGFDVEVEPGRTIWKRVQTLVTGLELFPEESTEYALKGKPRFGSPQTVLPRLGQGSFRIMVTDAYKRHCAITRSPILYVLEAAHIKPYPLGGPHSLQNGILLREDVHTLFDRGYLTVTPKHTIEVSRKIKEEFDNGKEYYALHGSSILAPAGQQAQPGSEYLSWHNDNVYRR